MKIKAIETWYAGCRFRSRLEARWAVFFDRLGIRWEYEPQGFLVGDEPNRRPYLPDFWLPAERLWVEVKGVEGDIDYELLVTAAIPHYGLPEARGLLVLGPLPRPGGPVAHSKLIFRKGDVFRVWTEFSMALGAAPYAIGMREDLIGNDAISYAGDGFIPLPNPGLTAVMPLTDPWAASRDPLVQQAYAAARSARFEHGERGA